MSDGIPLNAPAGVASEDTSPETLWIVIDSEGRNDAPEAWLFDNYDYAMSWAADAAQSAPFDFWVIPLTQDFRKSTVPASPETGASNDSTD